MKPDIVDKLEVSQHTFMEVLYWAMLSFVRLYFTWSRRNNISLKYAEKTRQILLPRDAKSSDSPWTLSLIYKALNMSTSYKDRWQIL